MILYIEEADYNPFLVTSTGAKIVIHDQDEYPFIEDIGTEIETATATSIGMHFVSDTDSGSLAQEAGQTPPVGRLFGKWGFRRFFALLGSKLHLLGRSERGPLQQWNTWRKGVPLVVPSPLPNRAPLCPAADHVPPSQPAIQQLHGGRS